MTGILKTYIKHRKWKCNNKYKYYPKEHSEEVMDKIYIFP